MRSHRRFPEIASEIFWEIRVAWDIEGNGREVRGAWPGQVGYPPVRIRPHYYRARVHFKQAFGCSNLTSACPSATRRVLSTKEASEAGGGGGVGGKRVREDEPAPQVQHDVTLGTEEWGTEERF
eukprot:946960-Rhodomonas_salina.1